MKYYIFSIILILTGCATSPPSIPTGIHTVTVDTGNAYCVVNLYKNDVLYVTFEESGVYQVESGNYNIKITGERSLSTDELLRLYPNATSEMGCGDKMLGYSINIPLLNP